MTVTAPEPITGNANQVRVGPGKIYVAGWTDPTTPPTLPTDLTSDLADDFREAGFTVDGSELTYSATAEQVEVAERLRGIKSIITAVEMTFVTTFAQLNPQNLALAMNADPNEAITTAAGVTTFTWPKAGGVTRCSIVWQSDDDLERLVLAKCFASGDISIARRKGVEPAAIATTFNVEENPAGDDAWLMTDDALLAEA